MKKLSPLTIFLTYCLTNNFINAQSPTPIFPSETFQYSFEDKEAIKKIEDRLEKLIESGEAYEVFESECPWFMEGSNRDTIRVLERCAFRSTKNDGCLVRERKYYKQFPWVLSWNQKDEDGNNIGIDILVNFPHEFKKGKGNAWKNAFK